MGEVFEPRRASPLSTLVTYSGVIAGPVGFARLITVNLTQTLLSSAAELVAEFEEAAVIVRRTARSCRRSEAAVTMPSVSLVSVSVWVSPPTPQSRWGCQCLGLPSRTVLGGTNIATFLTNKLAYDNLFLNYKMKLFSCDFFGKIL